MFCHKCGTQVNPDVQFCPNCGEPLTSPLASAARPAAPFIPPAGIKATPGKWIGEGWELVKTDFGSYAVISLIHFLLSGAAAFIIQGPLQAGFHIFTMKKMARRPADFADFFKGFNFLVPALVAWLLILVFTSIGLVFCIIPGLVLAAMYSFTYLFIVDKRMDFWPAMQASHAVVKNDYFGFTMFIVLAILVNLLGLLCCVVGLLVSYPVTIAAITVAYKELVGFDQRTIDAL
jgi:uncharacterized membrane protein